MLRILLYNNKPGKDRLILERYMEPAWNNPVVRVIDAEGVNVVKRISNDYSALTLCRRLKEALIARKIIVPEYVNLLGQEFAAVNTMHVDQKIFRMYCFWSGEKELGKLPGVLNVEAGFMDGNEVVKVSYDKSLLNEKELVDFAERLDFKPVKNGANKDYREAENDVRYYLKQSPYKYLPLTELQKTRINSALGSGQTADKYLSPKQKEWLSFIERNPKEKLFPLYHIDLGTAWEIMNGQIRTSNKRI